MVTLKMYVGSIGDELIGINRMSEREKSVFDRNQCFGERILKSEFFALMEEDMHDTPHGGAKASETQFPFNLVEAQDRGAALFTQLNELMVKTTRAIWESETELLRIETEQATKCFLPPKIGDDPGSTIADYCEQLHQRTDRMIAQMRRVNDLFKDCGWQVVALYAEELRQIGKQSASGR